jgi:hypothetical protein
MDAVLGDPLLHPDWYSLWHLPSGTRPPRTSMPLCSGFRGCCCCRRRMGRFSNALRLAVNPGPHLPRGFVGLPFSGPHSCHAPHTGGMRWHDAGNCRDWICPFADTPAPVRAFPCWFPVPAARCCRLTLRRLLRGLYLWVACAAVPCVHGAPYSCTSAGLRRCVTTRRGTLGLAVLPSRRGASPALASFAGHTAKGCRTGMMML